jgi:Ca2+-binding RTX toxin-like protein
MKVSNKSADTSTQFASNHFSRLVFIDSSIEDYQTLVRGVLPDTEVIVLHPEQDGMTCITQVLAASKPVSSLHIVSHGELGKVKIGSSQLSLETLDPYTHYLQIWSEALTDHATISLYGCNVAADEAGHNFIERLSAITGTTVAASDDLTGSAALGGDWDLEVTVGQGSPELAFTAEAMAAYRSVLVLILEEDFRGSDVTSGPWIYGVGQSNSTTPAEPFLTARSGTAPSDGGIPGGGIPLDPSGQGALRLTNNDFDQAAFVIYDIPIKSNAGLSITFQFFAYDGVSNVAGNGADGTSFFLIDGNESPQVGGAFGGSLGYAQRTGIAGLAGGYVGVGFDEFGNFSAGTEGRVGGAANPIPDSIGIRGSEASQYQFLGGTATIPQGIDFPNATNRNNALRTTRIQITPAGILSVDLDFNGDGDFLDAGEAVIPAFNITANNGTVPATFKFGFAASTGTFTNVHEVRNLQIDTLVEPINNVRPTVTDTAAALDPNTAINLTGLSATDPDGQILYYTILTLPPVDQGMLFLDDPAAGGVAVTVGQNIPINRIDDLYFQSSTGFTGTTFTYSATDNSGVKPLTAGIVTLALTGTICLPGITLVGNGKANNLRGTKDSDTLKGLAGNDRLFGLGCGDFLDGATGSDRLFGGARSDRLFGQAGNDLLDGGTGSDFISAGRGSDVAKGGQGSDRIRGNEGADDLSGGAGNDSINGFIGSDLIKGQGSNDILFGAEGNDRLLGAYGTDTVNGGEGNDTLSGGAGDDLVVGGSGNDKLVGNRGDDLLRGFLGDDRMFGGTGNDLINGYDGDDLMRGGSGNDEMFGATGDDTMFGENGDDVLNGHWGDDYLEGGNGDDYLVGSLGVDVLVGGAGNDRFGFTSVGQRGDTIQDFTRGDRIDLSQIFDDPGFDNANPFNRYLQIEAVSSGTLVRIDIDGDGVGTIFAPLVTLENVAAASIGISDFIV